jgi:Glycosyl hydrolase family 59 central domain
MGNSALGSIDEIGMVLFQHGSGVGLLDNGSSYVSLTYLTRQQLTIIIETI